KAEVRFRDPGLVRGLIVGALRHALAEAGHRASTSVASAALGAFREPEPAFARGGFGGPPPRYLPHRLAEQAAAALAPLQGLGPQARCRNRTGPSGSGTIRWARRGRSCTRLTLSPRRRMASSSSTSMRRMSGWSMSG